MPLRPALLTLALLLACTPPAREAEGRAGSGGTGAAGGRGGSGGPHQHGSTGGAGGAPSSDAAAAGGSAGSPADGGEPPGDDASDPSDMAHPITDPQTLAIAGQLQGAFLQLDCMGEEIELQYCVPKDRGIQNLPLAFGGQAGKSYAVVLRVWGVLEGVKYQGGMKLGENFYRGGVSETPKTALYGLTVGDQTYHLNHFDVNGGDHETFGVSYETPPITIPGASSLVLFVRDPDNFINTNHMETVAANPPPGLRSKLEIIKRQSLQGQFVYLEVASATPL